jgi:hypothetical protein
MGSRWKLPFEAIDPRDPANKTWTVGVEHARLEYVHRWCHESKLLQLKCVEYVLQKTETLYRSWGRENTDQNYVYVGSPKNQMLRLRVEAPADPKCLFVVFVRVDGSIADWEWRPRSSSDLKKPSGIEGEELWRA